MASAACTTGVLPLICMCQHSLCHHHTPLLHCPTWAMRLLVSLLPLLAVSQVRGPVWSEPGSQHLAPSRTRNQTSGSVQALCQTLDRTSVQFAKVQVRTMVQNRTAASLHSQGILSLLHNSLSAQVTEDFHRTIRRVWPRFQPKFCPCGDRSRQAGQTRTRTLSGVKAMAPLPSPTKKRSLFRQEPFPSKCRPTWRRTCKSVTRVAEVVAAAVRILSPPVQAVEISTVVRKYKRTYLEGLLCWPPVAPSFDTSQSVSWPSG